MNKLASISRARRPAPVQGPGGPSSNLPPDGIADAGQGGAMAMTGDVIRPLWLAAVLFAMFLAGVVLWAGIAPLSTTIRVPGKLAAADISRKVQHLSGGQIAAVDGHLHQTVASGDVLFRFDVEKERVRLRPLQVRLARRQEELRQVTGILDAVASAWPGHGPTGQVTNDEKPQRLKVHVRVRDAGSQMERNSLSTTQPSRYVARFNAARARLHLIDERRDATTVRLATLTRELAVRRAARVLLLRAVERAERLQDDGAMTLARLDELRGQLLGADATLASLAGRQAELIGQRDAFDAQEGQILRELQLQLAEDRAVIVDDIGRLKEEVASLTLKIERATVRAPVSGMISALPADTPGLVVRPGEVLAVISQPVSRVDVVLDVPTGQIDQVFAGQAGLVALSALPQRRLPPVRIDLTGVSRDPVDDPTGRSSYYLARGHINPDDLDAARAALGHDLHLASGMPVTVSLSGPQTTLLGYVLAPLTAIWGNAFEE